MDRPICPWTITGKDEFITFLNLFFLFLWVPDPRVVYAFFCVVKRLIQDKQGNIDIQGTLTCVVPTLRNPNFSNFTILTTDVHFEAIRSSLITSLKGSNTVSSGYRNLRCNHGCCASVGRPVPWNFWPSKLHLPVTRVWPEVPSFC